MKPIIISGISGFMGSNLKEYLNESYTISGLSRTENKKQNTLSYNQVYKSGLDNYLACIHLAGKAHDLKNTTEEKEYFEINTDLTKKLFDLFLQSNCEVFVFMSTVKAVADSVDGILTEESEPDPKTAYGRSKRAAEEYILSKKLPENKKVYILRPCMVHGPNNKGNLNLLYKIIKKGIPFPLGKFSNKRSFLAIDNLCYVLKQLLLQQPESNTFYLADDDNLSTNQLVKLIGKLINKPVNIINTPKWLIRSIATVGDFLPLPINSDRLQKLTENYCVSNRKIKETLNINLPLTAKQGFEKTLKSFQSN